MDTVLSKDADSTSPTIDVNIVDVQLSVNAMLDSVEALKSVVEAGSHHSSLVSSTSTSSTHESPSTQPQFAERRTTTKHPRKSLLQHRIITAPAKPMPVPSRPLSSSDQPPSEPPLSATTAKLPVRPLSISPAKYVQHFTLLGNHHPLFAFAVLIFSTR